MFTPPGELVVEAEAAAASEAVAALDLRPKFDVTTSAAVALWIHRRPSRNGIFLRARQQKSGKWREKRGRTHFSLFGCMVGSTG